MRTTTFCETCQALVRFTIQDVPVSDEYRGRVYQYQGAEARCVQCGSLVYVPEVDDEDLEGFYAVYRQEKGLIPLENIRSIPSMYSIGKRELSLLLGWREQTFSRFWDGDLPSKACSDILTRIYEDPAFYLAVLEEHKAVLPSQQAYTRSKMAALSLMDGNPGGPAAE